MIASNSVCSSRQGQKIESNNPRHSNVLHRDSLAKQIATFFIRFCTILISSSSRLTRVNFISSPVRSYCFLPTPPCMRVEPHKPRSSASLPAMSGALPSSSPLHAGALPVPESLEYHPSWYPFRLSPTFPVFHKKR